VYVIFLGFGFSISVFLCVKFGGHMPCCTQYLMGSLFPSLGEISRLLGTVPVS
jgi:hypothetical protein